VYKSSIDTVQYGTNSSGSTVKGEAPFASKEIETTLLFIVHCRKIADCIDSEYSSPAMKDVDRKAPIVRSFTLSGGSFKGEIVIDHPPPSSPSDVFKSSSTHSLPSKPTHSVSLETDTDDNEAVAPQMKPNLEALQVRKPFALHARMSFAQYIWHFLKCFLSRTVIYINTPVYPVSLYACTYITHNRKWWRH
jgi:hypothetical protein